MSKHSNKLLKWISKDEQEKIERLTLALEQKYPLEIVVSFTDRPAAVPFAAARMIALLVVAFELIAEAFWIPVPAWALGLTVFSVLLIPSSRFYEFWLFRLLKFKAERRTAIILQAEKCFTELGMARTKTRNALLVFFNMKEKNFVLLPDRTLAAEWPELKMSELVDVVGANMKSQKTAAEASIHLLEKIDALAQQRWPDAQPKTPANEIPNGVSWWDA